MIRHKSALVIEGDAHSLFAITSILREHGVSFKRNTNGVDVLRQLDSMSAQPDFILLNLDLPEGEAFAICDAIRSRAETKDIPIIATSYQTSPELTKQVRDNGFTGLIAKPLPRKDFGTVIDKVLHGQKVFLAD